MHNMLVSFTKYLNKPYLTFSDCRTPCPAAENMKISTKPATPTYENWIREVSVGARALSITSPSHLKLAAIVSSFMVLGFGAAASIDDGMSQQNGYPQNRYLKDAHQTLDRNLGKKILLLLSYII